MLELFKMVGVGWLFECRCIVIGFERLVDIFSFIDKVEHKGLLFPGAVTVESGEGLNRLNTIKPLVNIHGAQQRLVKAGLVFVGDQQKLVI